MDLNSIDQADLKSKELNPKISLKELKSFQTEKTQHAGEDSTLEVYMPQDKWMTGDAEIGHNYFQENLLFSTSTEEGALYQRHQNPSLGCWVCLENQHDVADYHSDRDVSPSLPVLMDSTDLQILSPVRAAAGPELRSFISDACTPIGSPSSVYNSSWDKISFRDPGSPDHCPVSAAAHLHLLGEALSLIGSHIEETNKIVCMSGSLSLLLDSLLCALAPLMCLTTQIPELTSCTEQTLTSTLENIVYMMPGL